MDSDDLRKVPSETSGGVAEGLVRAAVSAVPLVGGPVAELLGLVLEPSIHRRRERWLNQLAEAVAQLRERQVDIAQLANDESFITNVLTATTAAARTHEEEKLRALQNAVTRSALALGPDSHTQQMFIRFIDEFTALHLQILSYSRDPAQWYERHGLPRGDHYMGSRSTTLEGAFPELRGRSSFYSQLYRELGARGLVLDASLSGMVTAQAMWDGLTTDVGNQFLDFIADPPPP